MSGASFDMYLCVGTGTLTKEGSVIAMFQQSFVRCPGFGCQSLVTTDVTNATHVALGMACCSATCYESVYDLTRYVDTRVQVDEGLVIDLSTSEYRILEPP